MRDTVLTRSMLDTLFLRALPPMPARVDMVHTPKAIFVYRPHPLQSFGFLLVYAVRFIYHMQKYFQFKTYRDNPKTTFFAVCLSLFILGAVVLEHNTCQIVEYIYSSDRLSGSVPLICKIF